MNQFGNWSIECNVLSHGNLSIRTSHNLFLELFQVFRQQSETDIICEAFNIRILL